MFCGKSPTGFRPSMVLHKSRTKNKWHWADSLRRNVGMNADAAGLTARSTRPIRLPTKCRNSSRRLSAGYQPAPLAQADSLTSGGQSLVRAAYLPGT
jgi:hypothetical protein